MSTQTQLLESALGMVGIVQKAYIQVIDERNITNGISVDKAKTSSLFNSSLLNNVVSTVADVASVVQSALGAAPDNSFSVMFNPSTLHLSGHGGGLVPKMDFSHDTGSNGNAQNGTSGTQNNTEDNGHGKLTFGEAPVRMDLDMTLIFDKVYPANAFKADKIQSSYSGIVTGFAALATELTTGMNYSVQPEVEALIGALMGDDKTRKVIFYWGDMKYEGWLNRVNARYTMFNSSAEPIHAEVALSIILSDPKVTQLSMGQWDECYKKAFEQSTSYVTYGQMAESLFNFSL